MNQFIGTQYKLEGKVIYWYTGTKWLVKETAKNKTEAKKLLEQLTNKR